MSLAIKRIFPKLYQKIKFKINKKLKKKYSKNFLDYGQEKRFVYYKKLGLDFRKVLDIGAYDGGWTTMFKRIFPESDVLMIEANQEKEQALKSKGNYIIALLGSEDNKQVNYYKCKNSQIATGNSIYEENTFHEFKIEKRKTQKLSSISNIQGSYDLIKIDVQGSELEIIKGGLDLIKNTKFLLLEVSLANYNKGAPKIAEVLNFLDNINFELIDVFDLNYNSDCLIQFDGFFKNKSFNFKIINEHFK